MIRGATGQVVSPYRPLSLLLMKAWSGLGQEPAPDQWRAAELYRTLLAFRQRFSSTGFLYVLRLRSVADVLLSWSWLSSFLGALRHLFDRIISKSGLSHPSPLRHTTGLAAAIRKAYAVLRHFQNSANMPASRHVALSWCNGLWVDRHLYLQLGHRT